MGCYWLVKGFLLAAALSFVYMIAWSMMIKGFLNGDSFFEILQKPSHNGMTKYFMDTLLFGFTSAGLVFMIGQNWITYAIDKVRCEGDKILSEFPEKVEIKEEARKAAVQYSISYLLYITVMFALLMMGHMSPVFGKTVIGMLMVYGTACIGLYLAVKTGRLGHKHNLRGFKLKRLCLDRALHDAMLDVKKNFDKFENK